MTNSSGSPFSFTVMNRLAEKNETRRRNGLPVLSDARPLSDDRLVARLDSLGITGAGRWLRERCVRYRSAEELARALCSEHEVPREESDWVWFCTTLLWERWCPDVPNLEMVDDLMQRGYQMMEGGDPAGASDAWLAYWKSALKLMESWQITTISQFDEQFPQTQCLYNWCQDFEMELGNAGLSDGKYTAARLEFCRQIMPLVDPDDELMLQNMRRAMAESHFALGEQATAERLYRQWLEAEPEWGWGWIGWSDLYGLLSPRTGDPRRAEEILTRALRVSGLRDRVEVLQRLSDLYQDTGQEKKRREILRQLQLITSRSGPRGVPPEADSAVRQNAAGPVVGKRKIGRNDPCPCGSGKKYKRCCGR
jgi:hypothetical protein